MKTEPGLSVSMSRSKHTHWLIDSATSVLKPDFIKRYIEDESLDIVSSVPFCGPLQLPTKMQALKLYWYIRDEIGRKSSKTLGNTAIQGIVARTVMYYWTNFAAYKVEEESSARKQVKRLVDVYQTLMKSKNKDQPTANRNREAFLAELNTCLNVGKPGLRKKLMTDRVRSNLNILQEDVDFLDDQLGPRLRAMSHKPDNEFNARKAANLKRKLSPSVSPTTSGSSSTTESPANVDVPEDSEEDTKDEEQQEDNEKDEEYVPRQKRSSMINVQMPRNVFMSPELISSLDRCKTSDKSTMQMFSKLFKQFYTVDGKRLSLDELVLSRSSIRHNRIEQRNVIAEIEKENFLLNIPPRLSYGWDGKMIKDMENTKHEMQSMVVNGAPGYTEGKILDVIELTDEDGNPTSTGLAQAEASIFTVMEWGVANNIVALNFDTTASNTGHWSGAAIRLNQFLDKPLLYLACRHHVFDLLAKNTYHKVVGYDPSPDVAMFKRMKDLFPHIDTSGDFMMFDVDNKLELIELFTNILTKENVNGGLFVREDYRELCELALMMVGGELPGGKKMRVKAPGAAHKARFMAFALSGFKILAYSHLPEVREKCFSKKVNEELVFEEDTLENLWRWGQFAVKFYVPQFLLASLGRDAPSNDLNLYKSLIEYRNVDRELADIALDTLSRHKWYMSEYVAPFALFSDNVSDEEKAKMADRLVTLPRDEVPSIGHPDFPVVSEDTELWDLITAKSWQFFSIVKSDPNPKWLTQPVSEWDSDPDYTDIKAFVSTVKVVNDSCERAVALATAYARILTKDSSVLRKILQVVEAERKAFKDCNKATLNKQK